MTCSRPTPKPQIVTKRDTTVLVQQPIYVNPYQPNPVYTDPTIIVKPTDQPASDYSGLIAQYNALLQKYLETNKYSDTIKLTDSVGNDRGYVKIQDAVSSNKLLPRDVTYQLKYPQITITNTVTNPPPRQFFLGASATLTQATSLGITLPSINGGKVGLAYQDRKYNFIHADAGAINTPVGVKGYVEIGLYKPLSSIFKKK
jgi:hypothetical protein